MKIKVSHFFSWQRFDDELWPFLLAQFKAGGAENVVLGASWCERLIRETGFNLKLADCVKQSGLNFAGAHAPFGAEFDLNIPDNNARNIALQNHVELMDFAVANGIKTYTIHVGEFQRGYSVQQMRDFASMMLENLLCAAEVRDIIIAIENAEHPGGTLQELLFYRERFKSSSLGFCYDSGHANINGGDLVLDGIYEDIVTAHIHDNDGILDLHLPPGEGSIDWAHVRKKLLKAPRLMSIQNEVNSIAHNASIHSLCEFFNDFVNKEE